MQSQERALRIVVSHSKLFKPDWGKLGLSAGPSQIECVEDASLAPGDVIVESGGGWFDARISQRMDLLKERLRERHRKSHAS